MAFALVQTTAIARAAAAASVAISFSTAPTVGNAVIVLVNSWDNVGGTFGPTGCADNRGNSYSRAVTLRSGAFAMTAIYYCATVTTSAAPFTVTVGGTVSGAYYVGCALEVSGAGASGLTVDQTTSGIGGTPGTGTTAALTGSEAFVVATIAIELAQSSITVASASPAWVQAFEELPFSHIAGEGDSRVVSSAAGTTQSATWTITGGLNVAALAAFKDATAAAAVARADTFVIMPV